MTAVDVAQAMSTEDHLPRFCRDREGNTGGDQPRASSQPN